MQNRVIRRAAKAGSWYNGDGSSLAKELERYLAEAELKAPGPAKALIAPHAGYSYSGPTAAWAYRHVNPSSIKRVFLLGPSHHEHLPRCGLTSCHEFATPLGNIQIDLEVIAELLETGHFTTIDRDVDEDEHSLELQLPYIFKVMNGQPFKLVPIMVGTVSREMQVTYGRVLAPYFDDPGTLFIFSSDFCHWGKRFGYTHYEKSHGPIHESIRALDHAGMKLIEAQDPDQFHEYLKQYKNTICGRFPILLFLHILKSSKHKHHVEFVRYAQSNACTTFNDSSVSYASAVCTVLN